MNKTQLLALLNDVKEGTLSPQDAIGKLKLAPFEDIGCAKIDHHRALRQGAGEVIFGQGKTAEQILQITQRLGAAGASNVLITRMGETAASLLQANLPLTYYQEGNIGVAFPEEIPLRGCIVIASGGTSDIAVCEEAAVTAQALGSRVVRLYDVGVAGLHRLLANLEPLQSARVVIAVAGMEGALASVVGGLVDCPVLAVPTSIGYGASFGGVAALLSMLNSCASGVSVLNIDNGFGAGYLASMINQMEGIE